MILKKNLSQVIDWSSISKEDYLNAMKTSPNSDKQIKQLLKDALTSNIDSRELFMHGIDYSYYYEVPLVSFIEMRGLFFFTH